MTEPELKPLRECPFCGTEPMLDFIEGERKKDSDKYLIICTKCICQTNTYLYKQDAIDTWNTRAIDNKYQKAIEFIKKTVACQTDSYFIFEPYYVQEHLDEAEKLLRELGELE
jgi:Lar family restriction alleviation protein